jgi:hypothetical protein
MNTETTGAPPRGLNKHNGRGRLSTARPTKANAAHNKPGSGGVPMREQIVVVGNGTFAGKNAKRARKLNVRRVNWDRHAEAYHTSQRPGSLKG